MTEAAKENIFDFSALFNEDRELPPALVGDFGRAIAIDSSFDPFAERNPITGSIKGGAWPPLAQDYVPFTELWWTSLTPQGYFATWLTSRFALRNGWHYVTHKKSKTPVNNTLDRFLTKLEKDFDLKKNFQQADAVAKTLGRSLLVLEADGPNYYYSQPYLRVYAIREEDITYDTETGSVKEYHPIVRKGRGLITKRIKPENTIMFIWERDPQGNGINGIPSLVPIHRTIQQTENISNAYANLIVQRGISGVDVLVKGANTEKKLKPYAKKFGNWDNNSVMVHDENIELKPLSTMSASFNYNEVMDRGTKSVSSGTGYPSMRIEGVQTGAVTGSETDQDNTAENYAAEQEMFEPFMIQTIKLIALKVYGRVVKNFELDFDFDIKMDKAKLANIFQTYSNAFGPVANLIKVNQALTLLMLPPLEDDTQGNMLLSEYNDQFVDEMDEEEEDEEEDQPGKKGEEEKSKKDEKEDDSDIESISKENFARVLLKNGDSYRTINEKLKGFFGSGFGNDRIQELRNELDAQNLMLKTSKIHETIFKIKKEGHGFLLNDIYYITQNTIGFLRRQNKEMPIKLFIREYLNSPTIELNTILSEEQT